MTTFFTTPRSLTLSLGLLLLLGLASAPALSGDRPYGPRGEGHGPMHQQDRQAMLEALELTDDQRALWQDLRDARSAMHPGREAMRSAMADKGFLERLEWRAEQLKQRTAAMENVRTAAEAFYHSLEDEQQQFLDEHRGPRHGGKGHYGHSRGDRCAQ